MVHALRCVSANERDEARDVSQFGTVESLVSGRDVGTILRMK